MPSAVRWNTSTRQPSDPSCARRQPTTIAGRRRFWRSSKVRRFRCVKRDKWKMEKWKVESKGMFITKMALSRRMFLRGMGTAVALPLLDAMVPALTAAANTPAKPVRRLGIVYHPNGVIYQNWLPTGAGRDFEFSRILAPLE